MPRRFTISRWRFLTASTPRITPRPRLLRISIPKNRNMTTVGILAAAPQPSHCNSWSAPPSAPTLPTDRIDVWRVCLDVAEKDVAEKDAVEKPESKTSVLSPDEIARANRFHFEKDRRRFIRCRSALREILAAYIAIPAAEIRFEYLAAGKPQLAAEQNRYALQFNLSHSGSMALIAVGREQLLGVDIETIRRDVDTDALAERYFSTRERAALRALPDHLRLAAFYACWTRKEAFLKATGDGLSFPLADFSVTTHPDTDPDSSPKIEEIQGDLAAGARWSLADLSGIEGYRAALAIEGAFSRLETYAWN